MLSLGCLDDDLGERCGSFDLAVLQPGLDAPDTAATDGCRRLIAGQQQDGPFVRQAEGPLQSWADLQELLSEPVDLAGAIVDEVGAAADQKLEVDGYLVAWPEHAEVIAHAGLVGDDEGVLGVSLALAAVSS